MGLIGPLMCERPYRVKPDRRWAKRTVLRTFLWEVPLE